jgi:hypothetical protein
MNWFTLSLIAGIIFVVLGIALLLFHADMMATILCLGLGGAFLGLDLSPNSKSEFSGVPKEVFIKKIFGIVILVVAIVLFVIEIGRSIGLF